MLNFLCNNLLQISHSFACLVLRSSLKYCDPVGTFDSLGMGILLYSIVINVRKDKVRVRDQRVEGEVNILLFSTLFLIKLNEKPTPSTVHCDLFVFSDISHFF